MDRPVARRLLPRHRRYFTAADRADGLHDRAGGDRRLERDREARGAVLRGVPDPRGPDDRRVLRPRCAAVLLLLGSDADPDVPDHRHLGRAATRVCDAEILPVHLPRLGADAGGADLPVPEVGRLHDRRLSVAAADLAGTVLDLPGVPGGLCRQGADVAGAHLVAGCARRGADRRLGDPGGHHAEDGRVRPAALQSADYPGRKSCPRLARHRPLVDRCGLHRLRGADADRHEEADRLFIGGAHGLRHARRLPGLRHPGRHRRRSAGRSTASTARWCR